MDTPSLPTETLRVQFNFPLEQIKKPVIWHLAHDFGLMFSIRRANIDVHAGGFTVLELSGPRPKLEAGLQWVREQGVEVSAIGYEGTDEWANA